ncbi:barstar family protein [Kitasatospora sp. NBC_01302]|uniref:barstar family protein n=1 Tax=Kitasatospora sp. NBC_01302 TaxID=2903575 RepID=UPI002E10AE25|nr:barstar family protein [Kitasatospora sp. NBC_01302]
MYRLVDAESQSVLVVAEDIRGFFVGPDRQPDGLITFTGLCQAPLVKQKIEEAQLEVLNHRQERIGSYDAGPVLLTPGHGAVGGERGDLECSYLGYTCEYESAGEIWRRWAQEIPLEQREWARWPAGSHWSWLHVAQVAWFTGRRRAMNYGTASEASIDGGVIYNKASFYCALGEAVNGPGGYFGSNIDAVADCLSASRESMANFQLTWDRSALSRELLGEGFMASVARVMRDFGVDIIHR